MYTLLKVLSIIFAENLTLTTGADLGYSEGGAKASSRSLQGIWGCSPSEASYRLFGF